MPKNVFKESKKNKETNYLDQKASKSKWEGKAAIPSTPGFQVNLSTRGHQSRQLGGNEAAALHTASGTVKRS